MRIVMLVSATLLAAGAGGHWLLPHAVDVADAPQRLDATDLDGDGDIDLFVLADAAGDAASLQVLLNENGEFEPGWSTTQSFSSSKGLPFDLDLGDTDDDGDADVLYLLPFGSPYQRFNDGGGAFSGFDHLPAFAPRAAQEPADMDLDGDTDVVYYEEDIIGYFGTLEGFGNGEFQFDFSTETWFGLIGVDLARQVELGDVTGDGVPDAAMASKSGLGFFESGPLGSGLPTWHSQAKLYDTACADVALADLDGNGRLDLVATVPSTHSVVVFLKRLTVGFTGPLFFSAGAEPLAIAATDLDLDGHADVIVTNPLTNRINVLLGAGDGTLGAPEDFRVGRTPVDVVAADFENDGDPDLAVACSTGGHVTVLMNNSALPHAVISGWR